jgi:arylsulfatase A
MPSSPDSIAGAAIFRWGFLQGYGRMFLREGRQTVPALLKSAGYSTAVIGKWHLGLDWVVREEYLDSLQVAPAGI